MKEDTEVRRDERILKALDDPFFQERRVLLWEQHRCSGRWLCGVSMGCPARGEQRVVV